MRVILATLVLLAACQTAPADPAAPAEAARPQTASVPIGSDSEALAERACGGPARPETVHHETGVVVFRCIGTEP